MGPAGNWSLAEDAPANAAALQRARVSIVALSFASFISLDLDIDLHLIVGVVEIAAWIPRGRFGLHSSLAVGGAGKDYVVSAPSRLPVVGPETPCVFSLVFA